MRDNLEELNNAIGDLGDMVDERRGNEAWDAWHTMEKERPLKVVTAGKVS